MIDPIISLAFSLHSNKGVYALLIGSGVSRSAGIPTGWEVVLDLVRKLSYMKGEDCEPDPIAWYKKNFKKDPDYAELLDAIAKSPIERNQLLKSYFEPNDEEHKQGLKVPTESHKAIADLVSNEYIKIIITTNFDRLMERALESKGIFPTVISTPDSAEGAPPITHKGCFIIKVNGDYLDTRIKNTPKELSKYDRRINLLLDRIFDEFGLITCGWSAEWDTALRASLERCKNHRYTTFWATKSKPKKQSKKLVIQRRAQEIRIVSADSFFTDLSGQVLALEEYSKPHPLSVKTAVVTLKKYIADEKYKIHLHDLVMNEANKVYNEIVDDNRFPTNTNLETKEVLNKRVKEYGALVEILQSLIITGCYWGEKENEKLWAKCIERIANHGGRKDGLIILINLKFYPALLLLYAGGIASIAAEKYHILSAILTKAQIRENSKSRSLVNDLYAQGVMDQSVGRLLSGMERRHTPLSDYLHDLLRESFKEFLPHDAQYEECFDRFEYILAMVYADEENKQGDDWAWVPTGRFGWRKNIIKQIDEEVKKDGKNWLPLRSGLFDGDLDRLLKAKKVTDEHVRKLNRY